MAKLLKLRRGTTTQHASFTGAEGELTVDITKDTAVVHDGSQAGGTPLAGVDKGGSSIGSPGGDGTETAGGNGGGGGDNEDQAGGQTGGVGGDNEQAPGNGPDDDSQGGDAGSDGAAIRETSGVSFTFNTTGGTIQPSSFTNAANAQQGVA